MSSSINSSSNIVVEVVVCNLYALLRQCGVHLEVVLQKQHISIYNVNIYSVV